MRRRNKPKRWQRRVAAFLAMLLFSVGILHTVTDADSILRQTGRQMLQTAGKKIVFDAVCAISPLIGYILDMDSENTESETVPSGPLTVTIDEEAVRAELEQLLLKEQAEGNGWAVSLGPDNVYLFPEDMDEAMDAVTELDADLLAQIEKENEALQELARSQAQNGSAGDSDNPDQKEENLAQKVSGQPLPLAYSMEQLGDLDFLVKNCYNVNKTTTVDSDLLNAAAMLEQDMTFQEPDSTGPKILIHHTHATEYFSDSNENDPATLIVGVGDYLEEILETQYGIEVIHDRTVYPYNEAYSQALKNVEQILAENPSIEVFIDLHRDSGGQKKYTVEFDGKEMANLMFFNGLSRNVNGPIDYLENKNLNGNLAFSFQLKMAGDSMYPGLCKRNYLKSYRYNLHVLPRAVIVEVGDNNNTVQEAKNAMEPLARILNYVLTGG